MEYDEHLHFSHLLAFSMALIILVLVVKRKNGGLFALLLPDTLNISNELQMNTLGAKIWTSDQGFGDTQVIKTDCYGHGSMSWDWINLSQAKALIIFKCVISLFLFRHILEVAF